MIDYFVFAHDLALIENWNTHIAKVPNNYFLLLGIDKQINTNTQSTSKIISCFNLKNNIEQYPYLCSYTGWYAIVKNDLNTNKTICLLEYDIKLSSNFYQSNIDIVTEQKNNNYIISYNKTLTNHYVFYKSTPWLELALNKVYNIDLIKFVESYHKKYPFWPTTTNVTMPIEILRSFVEWFEPMTKLFRSHPLGAYVHERAFFIFCAINDVSIIFNTNTLMHQQKQSHRINDIYGTFLKRQKSYFFLDNMKPEYDRIYNSALKKIQIKNDK